MIFFVFDRVENIVGKGENAGYQHFLLFLIVFKRLFSQGPESWDCVLNSLMILLYLFHNVTPKKPHMESVIKISLFLKSNWLVVWF